MTNYLLDANVLIEAKNRYYAFDIVPAFWDWLDAMNMIGDVASVRPVLEELIAGDDELAEWARDRKATWGLPVDEEEVQEKFAEIAGWVVSNGQFNQPGRNKFLDCADPWLIAYAAVRGAVVVTHEVFAADARKKVPIPNVCRQFDVKYLDTFQLMRKLKASFS